ncbi:MAG TPA: hypothetical protein VFZ09_09280 [Archangium sp.]|uniref:hypothetical protein n=1 Tax=Archangium sp. TaxID=1872627 RepID=UPI002E313691|nr:hypothetical protein [Archangium sp.]HEX5746426.1 hypothetical protein [Archangium sp.]
MMNTLRVDARVVETGTGRIIRSVGAQDTPEKFLALEQELARELRAVFEELAAPEAEAGRTPAKLCSPGCGPGWPGPPGPPGPGPSAA